MVDINVVIVAICTTTHNLHATPNEAKSNEYEPVKSVKTELRVSIPNFWADAGNTCFGNRKSSFARSA